jgi:hypothetical protein
LIIYNDVEKNYNPLYIKNHLNNIFLYNIMGCSICLEGFEIKDMIETSCHHFFCENCFVNMLYKTKNKCALCRTPQTDWELNNITIDSIEFI